MALEGSSPGSRREDGSFARVRPSQVTIANSDAPALADEVGAAYASSSERIIEALTTTPDFSLASRLLLAEAQKLAPCQIASAYSIDESADEAITILFASSVSVREEHGDTAPLGGGRIAQLINAGLPRIESVKGNISFLQESQEYLDAGIKAGLWAPLTRQGHLLGLLALFSQDSSAFDKQALLKVEALGRRIALSIESAARYVRALRQHGFAQALNRASRGINSGPDANQVLQTICRECCNLHRASRVVLRAAEGDALVCRLAWPPGSLPANGENTPTPSDLPVTRVAARVALTGEAEVINHIAGIPHTLRSDEVSGLGNVASVMAVPLKGKDRVIGVLEISHAGNGRRFTNRGVEMVEAFASLAAIALQNTQRHEETMKALGHSEAQQRAILEVVPDAMFRVSRDGTYLDYITPANFALILPAEEFLGKTVSDVMPAHIAQQSLEGIGKALSSGQVQTLEYQLPINDRVRDYEVRIVANGEDEVLAIVRDVTDRKFLEAQFLQSQKLESLGRLAGGIAHDFNNLLGGIMGYASLLKGKVDPTSEAYEFASIIEKATERGAQLTQELLTAARKSPFDARPVDVSEVMQGIVQVLSHTLSREIMVVARLQPDLPAVQGDQAQIHQVLRNLCINAADAMPDGGTLTLSNQAVFLDDTFCQKHVSVQPGHYVQLAVADTGVGISQADQAKIFDPFFTTKDPGKGTGLGLAVVYAIVKNHRGLIEVTSAPGQGSLFTVYLPVSGPESG